MKKLIFLILMITGIFFLSSCCSRTPYLLTGKTAEIKNITLVSVIWYKPGKTGWEVVKSWDTNDSEMKTIRQLLMDAKDEGKLPWHRWYKLSLFFYNGLPEHFKLKEITFDLKKVSEKKILFEGSAGASYELGNLLSKYEFVEKDSELSPGMKDMIRQSKEAQRKAVEVLKEKEREKDPNQPSQKRSE
ncbi:MAG: hypothetical protein ABR969_06460 [Sedimentisphaerales bacterium]|jgi:hypothetical protein